MGRKKIEIKYVKNQAHRNAFFQKRVRGAFKKASELSGLCGARICVSVEDTDHRRLYVYNTHVDHEVNSDKLQYASANGLQINVYQPTEKLFKKIINDQHNESYRQNLQQLPSSNSMGCQQQQQKLKQKQAPPPPMAPPPPIAGIQEPSTPTNMQMECSFTPPPMAGIHEPSTPTNMQMEGSFNDQPFDCSFLLEAPLDLPPLEELLDFPSKGCMQQICTSTPPPSIMTGIQEPSTPTNMQMEGSFNDEPFDCNLLLENLHDIQALWEEMFDPPSHDQYEEPDQHNILTPASILQQQQHGISRQQQQEQILTLPSLGQQHQYGSPREQQQESHRQQHLQDEYPRQQQHHQASLGQQNHQASLGQQHRQDEFPQQQQYHQACLSQQHRQDEYPLQQQQDFHAQQQHDDQNAATSRIWR